MQHAVHAAIHQADIVDADALALFLRRNEKLIERVAALLHVLDSIAVDERRAARLQRSIVVVQDLPGRDDVQAAVLIVD